MALNTPLTSEKNAVAADKRGADRGGDFAVSSLLACPINFVQPKLSAYSASSSVISVIPSVFTCSG